MICPVQRAANTSESAMPGQALPVAGKLTWASTRVMSGDKLLKSGKVVIWVTPFR